MATLVAVTIILSSPAAGRAQEPEDVPSGTAPEPSPESPQASPEDETQKIPDEDVR